MKNLTEIQTELNNYGVEEFQHTFNQVMNLNESDERFVFVFGLLETLAFKSTWSSVSEIASEMLEQYEGKKELRITKRAKSIETQKAITNKLKKDHLTKEQLIDLAINENWTIRQMEFHGIVDECMNLITKS